MVFSVLFGKENLFCSLVSAVTGDKIELDGELHSQATLREDDVLLNTIRFDTFAKTKNKRFYTADMQRSFYEARLERRTTYYACRTISNQVVKDMVYEDLNPVNIAFILTSHGDNQAIRRIKLCDIDTHEIFSDLIEITYVYIKVVLKNADKKSDIYLFSNFFAISSQKEADNFVKEFERTKLGKELIEMYNKAVSNVNNLREIESSPYYTGRLNEAQLEAERIKAEKKGIKKGIKKGALAIAKNLLLLNLPLEQIISVTGLSQEEVEALRDSN